MKLRAEKHLLPLLALPVGLLLLITLFSTLNCGSGKEERPGGAELNACTLLAETNPAEILGEPVGDAHSALQEHGADMAVSQCGVSAVGAGLKSVSLLVKYYRKYSNPKTAQAFLETLDFGEFKVESKEVPGLGDVAGSGSFGLWVFWKKHLRMNVTINGIDNEREALEKTKSSLGTLWLNSKSSGL